MYSFLIFLYTNKQTNVCLFVQQVQRQIQTGIGIMVRKLCVLKLLPTKGSHRVGTIVLCLAGIVDRVLTR